MSEKCSESVIYSHYFYCFLVRNLHQQLCTGVNSLIFSLVLFIKYSKHTILKPVRIVWSLKRRILIGNFTEST